MSAKLTHHKGNAGENILKYCWQEQWALHTAHHSHPCLTIHIALYFTFMMTYVSHPTPNNEPHPAPTPTPITTTTKAGARNTRYSAAAKMFIWRVAATQIIVEQHVACVSVRDDALNFIYDYVCSVFMVMTHVSHITHRTQHIAYISNISTLCRIVCKWRGRSRGRDSGLGLELPADTGI